MCDTTVHTSMCLQSGACTAHSWNSQRQLSQSLAFDEAAMPCVGMSRSPPVQQGGVGHECCRDEASRPYLEQCEVARAKASQHQSDLSTHDRGGIVHPRQHSAGNEPLCGQAVFVTAKCIPLLCLQGARRRFKHRASSKCNDTCQARHDTYCNLPI